jgi:hypothetical protein
MCSVFKTERLGFMVGATGAGKDNQAGEYLKTLLATRPIGTIILVLTFCHKRAGYLRRSAAYLIRNIVLIEQLSEQVQ